MIRLFALLAVTLSLGSMPAFASRGTLCEQGKTRYLETPKLLLAAEAVYGAPLKFSKAPDCDALHGLLEYPSATVLIVIENAEENSCHACEAVLSAFVLKSKGPKYTLIKSFPEFTALGTFGNPGELRPVRIAGDDAFAVEHGGLFQGYLYSGLEFFRFRAGLIENISMEPKICLQVIDASLNGDPEDDFSGTWRIGGKSNTKLFVEFVRRSKKRPLKLMTEWRLEDSGWVLSKGKLQSGLGLGQC